MNKVWKRGLRILSALGLAISFLCYSSIDVSAQNEVTMLVCGDTKMESREAFSTLYRDLMGGEGISLTSWDDHDHSIGVRGGLNLDNVSATLNMYYVDDLKTIPELLIPSDLLVLVYAGKEAKGLGNLPLLKKELKSRKHRIELPEMVLLRLDEVLASPKNVSRGCCGCFGTSVYNEDEEDKGETWYVRNLIKACGKLWPRCPVEEDRYPNYDGWED